MGRAFINVNISRILTEGFVASQNEGIYGINSLNGLYFVLQLFWDLNWFLMIITKPNNKKYFSRKPFIFTVIKI